MTTRRDMLKTLGATALTFPVANLAKAMMRGGSGGSGGGTTGGGTGVTPFSLPLVIPPVLAPSSSTSTTDYYDLQIGEAQVEIIPGKPTTVIGFNGSTPGPTIRARTGRKTVVTHYNGLPNTTLGGATGNCTIHLHGAHVPAIDDGYTTDYIQPGSTRTYTYPNNQLSTMLWYHDHTMDDTGPHVWYGMAGLYMISDDYEESLGLPDGEYEVPLVIQDRNFDANGQFIYTRNRMSGEMGDTILVNGVIQPYFNVAKRKYRLRVLNGSNSRFYNLAFSNGQSFQVIGMEGGLLERPVTVNSLKLAPAERADIIISFSGNAIGSSIDLVNTRVSSTTSTYNIMRFNVSTTASDNSVVPSTLRPFTKLNPADAVTTRSFTVSMVSGGKWVFNGLGFDPARVDAQPKLGTTEIWSFTNRSGMDHPIHMHDNMFQILDINGNPPPATHAGWKDVVIVPPMGTARVIKKFEDYTGLYMFHCHMLEHEDYMLMSQFKVTP